MEKDTRINDKWWRQRINNISPINFELLLKSEEFKQLIRYWDENRDYAGRGQDDGENTLNKKAQQIEKILIKLFDLACDQQDIKVIGDLTEYLSITFLKTKITDALKNDNFELCNVVFVSSLHHNKTDFVFLRDILCIFFSSQNDIHIYVKYMCIHIVENVTSTATMHYIMREIVQLICKQPTNREQIQYFINHMCDKLPTNRALLISDVHAIKFFCAYCKRNDRDSANFFVSKFPNILDMNFRTYYTYINTPTQAEEIATLQLINSFIDIKLDDFTYVIDTEHVHLYAYMVRTYKETLDVAQLFKYAISKKSPISINIICEVQLPGAPPPIETFFELCYTLFKSANIGQGGESLIIYSQFCFLFTSKSYIKPEEIEEKNNFITQLFNLSTTKEKERLICSCHSYFPSSFWTTTHKKEQLILSCHSYFPISFWTINGFALFNKAFSSANTEMLTIIMRYCKQFTPMYALITRTYNLTVRDKRIEYFTELIESRLTELKSKDITFALIMSYLEKTKADMILARAFPVNNVEINTQIETTECIICYHHCCDTTLPCGHNISCYKCISTLYNTTNRDYIECPLCRATSYACCLVVKSADSLN